MPSWPRMAPSLNSTMEWTMLWGCTITDTCASGSRYSRMASMTSRPLFISVEQSTVILGPMVQLGCRRASARGFLATSSRHIPRKGPPEQVRISRRISWRSAQPCKHWKIAECSLSTGTISVPQRSASSITSVPAHTSVSLLARAMRFFSRMAARVGCKPTMPTTAVTTVSASSSTAASISAAVPANTFTGVSAKRIASSFAAVSSVITAKAGRNFRHWASIRSTLELAVSAATRSPSCSATSRVWRPMEPVEPNIEIVFVMVCPLCLFVYSPAHTNR